MDNSIKSIPINTNSCSAVSADSLLITESFIIIILASFALLVNCIFLSAVHHSTGHTSPNVRALLVSVNICIIVRSWYFIIRGVYLLCLLFVGFEKLVLPPLVCATIELPYAVSSMCMVSTFLAIGMERFVATVNTHTEDRVQKGVKFMIGFCWIQAMVVYALMLTAKFASEGPNASPVCYCIFSLLTKFYAAAANNVYFGMQEMAILLAYCIVLAKNRKKLVQYNLHTRQHSLNDRYGVWTNVRTTRMLLPAATVHASVFLIVLFGGIPAYGRWLSSPSSESLNVIVTLNLFCVFDLIAHPLLCVRFNERYRLVIGEKWPRFFWLFGAYRGARRVAPAPAPQVPNGASMAPFSISMPSTIVHPNRDESKTASSSGQCKQQVSKQELRKLSKRDLMAGKKMIVDFRLHPDDNNELLIKMWTKNIAQ